MFGSDTRCIRCGAIFRSCKGIECPDCKMLTRKPHYVWSWKENKPILTGFRQRRRVVVDLAEIGGA